MTTSDYSSHSFSKWLLEGKKENSDLFNMFLN